MNKSTECPIIKIEAMANDVIDEKIGEGLVRWGVLSDGQVKEVLAAQLGGDKRLFGEIALEKGYLTVRALMDYLRA